MGIGRGINIQVSRTELEVQTSTSRADAEMENLNHVRGSSALERTPAASSRSFHWQSLQCGSHIREHTLIH